MRSISRTLDASRDPMRKAELQASVPELDVVIQRFHPTVRAGVRRFVYTSSRVADLATVFPGAVYALAARHGPAVRRRKALELIENGALLKEVARALELPLWLRRLPPEAFRRDLGVMAQSDAFARRIANHLPRAAGESALWLEAVLFGCKAADEYFALWLASQVLYHDTADADQLLAALAAYAWFSGATGTLGYSLVVVPWRPEMAFDTALCAAKSWLNRVRLILQIRPGTISDSWLAAGEANGFSLEPLVDYTQILAEAQAMHNCADQYADRLARERCRLFSMRRRGQRVATVEVGAHPREPGMLTITQLKARHNMPASSEVWQAAYSWLAAQKDLRRMPALVLQERPLNAEVWESLMLPYRLARRGAPWMPETLSVASFSALDAGLAELARRGGVSSWLFT